MQEPEDHEPEDQEEERDDSAPKKATPGCFGAPSVFALDSNVCMACHVYNECRRTSYATLERLRGRIDVSEVLKRHAQARAAAEHKSRTQEVREQIKEVELDPEDRVLVDAITNRNARQLATALCKAGLMRQIAPSIRAGKNPFVDIDDRAYMRVVCQVLIDEGGFSKLTLARRLATAMRWAKGTAESHRAFILAAMAPFDILVETNNYFTLKQGQE